MVSNRNFVIEKLQGLELELGLATKIEDNLYSKTCQISKGKIGMDFISFRRKYRHLFNYLYHGIENNGLFKEIIMEHGATVALETDLNTFFPELIIQEKEEEPDSLRVGTYRCNKCVKNKRYALNTSYYEKQTRSSDEPMTIFISCITCGFKWKQ